VMSRPCSVIICSILRRPSIQVSSDTTGAPQLTTSFTIAVVNVKMSLQTFSCSRIISKKSRMSLRESLHLASRAFRKPSICFLVSSPSRKKFLRSARRTWLHHLTQSSSLSWTLTNFSSDVKIESRVSGSNSSTDWMTTCSSHCKTQCRLLF
jgi:hypothetical protein